MRILIIADQPTADLVRKDLIADGTTVETVAPNSPLVLDSGAVKYDAILLEQNQPREPGWSHVASWRREGLSAHVLVLLPKNSEGTERAAYLDAGADIILLHPLSLVELKAHLRALQRRSRMQHTPVRRVHDLELNTATRSAIRAGRPIHLTPREFDLLHLLATHPGKVMTRSAILEHLYEEQESSCSNIVDVYVGYLRGKIDKGFKTPLILTRWGQGYLLRPEGA